MTVNKRFPLLLAFAAASLLAIQPVAAVTSTFKIYIDAGNDNAATSCTDPSVPFRFDEVLTTTVDTSGSASASVTAVVHQACVAGALDPTPDPVPGPPSTPWNVGIGNGDFGQNVVETFFKFSGAPPTTARLALVATGATGGQDVVTTTATGGPTPIVLTLAGVTDIPTLGTWSLALLALLLTLAAGRLLRRRGAMIAIALVLFTSAGALWAVCLFDGLTNDWSAGDRVAQDNAGDSGGGPDVRSFYAKFEGGVLCLRVDSSLIFNNPPTANAQALSTVEDTALPLTMTGSDPDSDPLTFSIVSGPASGTLGPLTGATATSVNVTYTPNADFNGSDSFVFQVADGFGGTSQATVSITVTAVDDPPVAVNDSATVNEDSGPNAVNVLANDSDVDAGPISITAVTQPANGAVVITGGGTALTYAPNANYCNNPPGTTLDTFTYTLTPGSSSATVTMTVTCVDDAPVAVADAATVVEDSGANAVNVLANDTDLDGGAISVASVTNALNGAVAITGGGTGVTYTPNANYCNNPPGTTLDTFTYTLAPGGSSTTVTMTVTCVDDAPVAVADTATVAEDAAATAVNVLANDTDTDGGAISITSVTQPGNGAVVITGGGTGLTYAPNANYCNTPPGTTLDTFTYTLTPGGSSTTVTVTVTCVDDNPVAVADAATVNEDSGANAVNVLANDTDIDAGPKSVGSVTQPGNGAVVITGGGTGLTYAPNANYCNNPPGTTLDTFTYTLTPGSSSTTVTMTVNCVDDPPTAVSDAATVAEDSGANAIPVLANDPDLDGGPKLVGAVTQPANGAVVITGGGTGLTYAPNANYCNQPPGTTLDTFTYTLTPGGSVASVTVTVSCLNDAPVLDLDANDDQGTPGANFAVTFTEGNGATLIEDPLDATVTDVDNANLASLTVTITNLFDTGFETLTADTTGTSIVAGYVTVPGAPGTGTLTLTGPDTVANFQTVLRKVRYLNTDNDPDTTPRVINFVANDGAVNSNTAVSTVTVVAVDSPPVAVADAATVNEDSGANAVNVLANDTDVDGGPKSVGSVTQPTNGTVVITGGGTGLTYAPNANYCNQPPGTTLDTFTYTLTPGGSSTTVTMTVTCADDNPVAVADAATVVEDSGANAVNVLANDTDPDGGPKSVASVTQPANGAVVITGGGTGLTYAPNANYCNTPPGTTLDIFTYTLTPGSSSTTVTMTVTCVDDNPVAVADAATVVEDSGANAVNVLANDTDVDGGPTSVASVTQPANGAVVITGGGTGLTYAPNANYCNQPPGTTLDTFTYTLTPGSSSTTVTMTVTCVDDAPVAVADAATVNEDSGANAVNVLANDTDIDGGPKSVASVTQPANGAVVITGGGTGLTYAPSANYCNNPPGTTLDTFTYTLTPGSSSTTVTMTVTCVDDSPLAVADAATVVEDSGANAVNVLANDTDVDGGAISIASVTQPANGAVVITGGGTGLTYAPNANYCNNPPGTTLDTFTYTLAPGSSSTTVTMTVTCVDDSPLAVADAATVVEDSGANAVNVLANDTDVDAGPKSVASVTQPANGAVVITGGGTGLTYAPNANYCNNPPGTTLDTFTYTLTPGSSSTTVTMTVTCVDDPPVAVADAATVNEDSGSNAINVLANDTDIDAGPKSVASVTQPANGTVVITGGGTGLTYAPNLNYCNNPPGTTPNTFTYTLTPGSSSTTVSVLVNCVNDPPVAGADAFDFIGNTELRVDQGVVATPHVLVTTGLTFGLLNNDSDPVEGDPIAVTSLTVGACTDSSAPFDCTDAAVGTVNLDANGRFTFVPAPGDAGATETFTYVISDTGVPAPASATGTVTLTRFGRVWYVKNDQAAGGLGRSADPFDTLVEAETASVAGDTIYVHNGSGTTTGQANGIVLKNTQRLIGEGVQLTLPVAVNGGPNPTLLRAAGTRPMLDDVDVGGNAVGATDAIPIEIVGLNLAGNTNGIDLTTAGAFAGSGSLEIRDNIIRATTNLEGIDVNAAGTGTLNLSIHDNTITANVRGIDIVRTAGIVNITAFDDNVVTGNTGGSGIEITGVTFDAVPGVPINQVAGGVTVVGQSGNGVSTNGILLTSVVGDLSFTDLDIFNDNGAGLRVTSTGALNAGAGTGFRIAVGAGVSTLDSNSGPAIDINNSSVSLPINFYRSINSPTTGLSLVNAFGGVGSTAFSASSGNINDPGGASGTAVNISGGNGNITIGIPVTNNSGNSVVVTGRTGDTVLFSGAVSDTNGSGISLTTNTGATINFTGGLTASTGASPAFTATGGGTVSVTGAANTLATTTGTALNVANTTIGASGLTFRSIAANGASSGIVLNNTGATAGLTVTGTGGAGTGGTIQNSTGHAISLTSTRDPSFTAMNLSNIGQNGVFGTGVTNFTFANGSITNVGTAALGQYNESGIAFNDGGTFTTTTLMGTVSITGNTITNPRRHGIGIENGSGTIANLTISSNSISSSTSAASSLGNGIHIFAQGSAATSAHITTGAISNNAISNFPSGEGILIAGGSGNAANVTSSTLGANGTPITISGNAIAGTLASKMGSNAIRASFNGQVGVSNFSITGNGTVGTPITHIQGQGISVFMGGSVTGTTTINNNVINALQTLAAGTQGMAVQIDDGPAGLGTSSADYNVVITNNSVSGYEGNGIRAIARASLGKMDVTIQNNTVGAPSLANRNGIRIDSGSAAGDVTLCLLMTGNASAGSGVNQGMGVRKQGTVAATNEFGIVGLAPSPTTGANAAAKVTADNPAGNGTDAISGDNFISCTITP